MPSNKNVKFCIYMSILVYCNVIAIMAWVVLLLGGSKGPCALVSSHIYYAFLALWQFDSTGCLPCQGNPFSHKNVRKLSGKFDPFLQWQGIVMEIWPFLQTSKNDTTYSNHQFLPLCHYLFCEIYVVERSKEYQANNERNVCPTCKKGVIEGVNLKSV